MSSKLTLAEFAKQRSDQDRQVSVFVEGDPNQDPPEGRATACRVANILQSGEGSVIDVRDGGVRMDSLAKGSVLLFTMSSEQDDADWAELIDFGDVVYPIGIHTVIHADEVSDRILQMMDVRVVAGEGIDIRRLRVDNFKGEVYETEMRGLTT